MEDDFGEKFQKKVVEKIQYSACRNKNNAKITVGLPCGWCITWWRFGQYYKYKKIAYMIFNLKLEKKILSQLVRLVLYKDIIIVNMQKKSWENICKYGFYGPLLLGNFMENREMRQCSPSIQWVKDYTSSGSQCQHLMPSTATQIQCHYTPNDPNTLQSPQTTSTN